MKRQREQEREERWKIRELVAWYFVVVVFHGKGRLHLYSEYIFIHSKIIRPF